jgi:Protein of unknown function (DUF3303)
MRYARARGIMVALESDGAAAGKRPGNEARTMLFVALLSTKSGNTFQEGVAKRLQWDYPEGANVLAEYWLETEAPRVVAVVETESMEPFGQIRMDWGDMFEIEVFPVVTAEQGMEMARQSMGGQG